MSLLESYARRIEEADGLDPLARLARSSAHDKLVAPPALDEVLGGGWLGHRLHPVAAQVPMGAWTMAVLLDLLGREKHAAAVDALLATGCLAALPTALAGAHDLGTTTGRDTRVALVHAGTMDLALGLFVVAWIKHRRGQRRTARRLLLAGVVTAGVGAHLGGHLVYRLGVGVED